ncbi:hypothetical protein PRZ48_000992 [Zasmidium cellare]|uniref:Uncharacterized protein n=1 Tax=Zasmidium cellare TaxID=395010 RepID=A0ABR0F0B4_ZASCE|nr:hypothetical protein PRZ48_000992 [Zasmidium cellare]
MPSRPPKPLPARTPYSSSANRISKPLRPSHTHRPKPSRFTRLAVSHILTHLSTPLSTLNPTSLRRIIHEQMDELLELKDEVEMEEVVEGMRKLGSEVVNESVEGLSEAVLEDEEFDGEFDGEESDEEEGSVEKYEDTMSGAVETEWSSDVEDEVDAAFFPLPDDQSEDEDDKSGDEVDGDEPPPDDEKEQRLPDI